MRRSVLTVSCVLLGLAACTPTVDLRGKLPSPEALAQVKIGETTDEQVQLILGSPSATSDYGGVTWHYIFERTETTSFLDPKVKEYKVVSVAFDNSGKVQKIIKLDNKALKPVEVVGRETPTAGKELTVLEQLIGNVGKFKDGKSTK